MCQCEGMDMYTNTICNLCTGNRKKGLIAGLKGNQWLISPDYMAGYFWGGTLVVGWPAIIKRMDVRFSMSQGFEDLDRDMLISIDPATVFWLLSRSHRRGIFLPSWGLKFLKYCYHDDEGYPNHHTFDKLCFSQNFPSVPGCLCI